MPEEIQAPTEETPVDQVDNTPDNTPDATNEIAFDEGNTPDTPNADGEKINTNINFNDFKKAREITFEDAPEEKKVEEKKEEKVVEKPVEQPKTLQQPIQNAAPKITREQVLNELGVPAEQHPLFKSMSNDAFNHVKTILGDFVSAKKQIETLKKAQEETKVEPGISLYGNPEGYLLDPEYRKLSSLQTIAEQVKNHWIAQLDNIEKGEQWTDLDVDQNGKIYKGAKKEPTTEATSYLRQQLMDAEHHIFTHGKKVEDLKAQYKNQGSKDLEFIKQTESKFFPDYDKPDHPTRKVQDDFLQLLPKSIRQGNPLATVLAKTVANNNLLKIQAESALKELAAIKAENETLKKAKPANPQQPVKGKTQGDSGHTDSNQVTYEMFKRRKDNY